MTSPFVATSIGAAAVIWLVAISLMVRGWMMLSDRAVNPLFARWRGAGVYSVRANECLPLDDCSHGTVSDYLSDPRSSVSWVGRVKSRLSRTSGLRGAVVDDADGDPIYVVWVDDYRLAHRDVDALTEDVMVVVDDLRDGSDVRPTMSEYYYGDIVEGRVNLESSKERARVDLISRLRLNLKRRTSIDDEVDVEEFRESFVYDFRYPVDLYEEMMDELIESGIVEVRCGCLSYVDYS